MGVNGWKQVQVGVYGCERVRWGVGGTRRQENRPRRNKNDENGRISCPMAGEISPNIMFFAIWQKDEYMHADS